MLNQSSENETFVTYLFGASIHDLGRDLFNIVLDSLGLVFVLETERLVLDNLRLLFLESLGRRSLLLGLFGWHF